MATLEPTSIVESVGELREIVGVPTEKIENKKLDKLETTSHNFIAQSPFVCVTTMQSNGHVDVSARGGRPGFVESLDDETLLIPDHPEGRIGDTLDNVRAHPFAGLNFLIPGESETFRVNGRAHVVEEPSILESLSVDGQKSGAAIRIQIEEAYTHCPKAFIRSRLWVPRSHKGASGFMDLQMGGEERFESLDGRCRELIGRSPFLCLGTSLARGDADTSPRGDPPGFVRILDEKTLLLPDRPGNRLADNFRNILENPFTGLLFFVPGSSVTLRVHARARIVSDPELLEPLSIKGKQPAVGLWLAVEEAFLNASAVFARSQLWTSGA